MPANDVTVRAATPADLAGVTGCVRAAYQHYAARIGREPAPMTADYAALIARSLVTLLLVDSAVRGVLVMEPRGGAWFLENVAVHPASQGQGLGRRLMAEVEQAARAGGYATIELYTNALMTENLAYYPRLGYEETDRREEDGFSRVYFRKRLAPGATES